MVDLAALRAPLVAMGYDDEGLEGFAVARASDGSVRLASSSGDERRDTIAVLFGVGAAVERAAAEAALAPTDLDAWVAAGLLRPDGDRVVAPLRITPHGGFHIVCDFEHGAATEDVVPGPSVTTEQLLAALPREPAARALDLGTGPGYLALQLRRWSDAVVATDLTQRAVRLAGMTVRLNAAPDIDVRRGDRFEPVRDDRFDLIACNPPFVISPAAELAYRDAPQRGDRFCRDLIRALPDHLSDRGTAILLASWISSDDPRGWWSRTGLVGEVVEERRWEPESYARAFVRDAASPEGERRVAAWLAYYDREAITALSVGVLRLTRP
ncbi:MAG: methyltransferase [Actinobacteria bacterium]|nr:methyltransferase [Actinomycetota bacterium]